jgi:hypothetical protein
MPGQTGAALFTTQIDFLVSCPAEDRTVIAARISRLIGIKTPT